MLFKALMREGIRLMMLTLHLRGVHLSVGEIHVLLRNCADLWA